MANCSYDITDFSDGSAHCFSRKFLDEPWVAHQGNGWVNA